MSRAAVHSSQVMVVVEIDYTKRFSDQQMLSDVVAMICRYNEDVDRLIPASKASLCDKLKFPVVNTPDEAPAQIALLRGYTDFSADYPGETSLKSIFDCYEHTKSNHDKNTTAKLLGFKSYDSDAGIGGVLATDDEPRYAGYNSWQLVFCRAVDFAYSRIVTELSLDKLDIDQSEKELRIELLESVLFRFIHQMNHLRSLTSHQSFFVSSRGKPDTFVNLLDGLIDPVTGHQSSMGLKQQIDAVLDQSTAALDRPESAKGMIKAVRRVAFKTFASGPILMAKTLYPQLELTKDELNKHLLQLESMYADATTMDCSSDTYQNEDPRDGITSATYTTVARRARYVAQKRQAIQRIDEMPDSSEIAAPDKKTSKYYQAAYAAYINYQRSKNPVHLWGQNYFQQRQAITVKFKAAIKRYVDPESDDKATGLDDEILMVDDGITDNDLFQAVKYGVLTLEQAISWRPIGPKRAYTRIAFLYDMLYQREAYAKSRGQGLGYVDHYLCRSCLVTIYAVNEARMHPEDRDRNAVNMLSILSADASMVYASQPRALRLTADQEELTYLGRKQDIDTLIQLAESDDLKAAHDCNPQGVDFLAHLREAPVLVNLIQGEGNHLSPEPMLDMFVDEKACPDLAKNEYSEHVASVMHVGVVGAIAAAQDRRDKYTGADITAAKLSQAIDKHRRVVARMRRIFFVCDRVLESLAIIGDEVEAVAPVLLPSIQAELAACYDQMCQAEDMFQICASGEHLEGHHLSQPVAGCRKTIEILVHQSGTIADLFGLGSSRRHSITTSRGYNDRQTYLRNEILGPAKDASTRFTKFLTRRREHLAQRATHAKTQLLLALATITGFGSYQSSSDSQVQESLKKVADWYKDRMAENLHWRLDAIGEITSTAGSKGLVMYQGERYVIDACDGLQSKLAAARHGGDDRLNMSDHHPERLHSSDSDDTESMPASPARELEVAGVLLISADDINACLRPRPVSAGAAAGGEPAYASVSICKEGRIYQLAIPYAFHQGNPIPSADYHFASMGDGSGEYHCDALIDARPISRNGRSCPASLARHQEGMGLSTRGRAASDPGLGNSIAYERKLAHPVVPPSLSSAVSHGVASSLSYDDRSSLSGSGTSVTTQVALARDAYLAVDSHTESQHAVLLEPINTVVRDLVSELYKHTPDFDDILWQSSTRLHLTNRGLVRYILQTYPELKACGIQHDAIVEIVDAEEDYEGGRSTYSQIAYINADKQVSVLRFYHNQLKSDVFVADCDVVKAVDDTSRNYDDYPVVGVMMHSKMSAAPYRAKQERVTYVNGATTKFRSDGLDISTVFAIARREHEYYVARGTKHELGQAYQAPLGQLSRLAAEDYAETGRCMLGFFGEHGNYRDVAGYDVCTKGDRAYAYQQDRIHPRMHVLSGVPYLTIAKGKTSTQKSQQHMNRSSRVNATVAGHACVYAKFAYATQEPGEQLKPEEQILNLLKAGANLVDEFSSVNEAMTVVDRVVNQVALLREANLRDVTDDAAFVNNGKLAAAFELTHDDTCCKPLSLIASLRLPVSSLDVRGTFKGAQEQLQSMRHALALLKSQTACVRAENEAVAEPLQKKYQAIESAYEALTSRLACLKDTWSMYCPSAPLNADGGGADDVIEAIKKDIVAYRRGRREDQAADDIRSLTDKLARFERIAPVLDTELTPAALLCDSDWSSVNEVYAACHQESTLAELYSDARALSKSIEMINSTALCQGEPSLQKRYQAMQRWMDSMKARLEATFVPGPVRAQWLGINPTGNVVVSAKNIQRYKLYQRFQHLQAAVKKYHIIQQAFLAVPSSDEDVDALKRDITQALTLSDDVKFSHPPLNVAVDSEQRIQNVAHFQQAIVRELTQLKTSLSPISAVSVDAVTAELAAVSEYHSQIQQAVVARKPATASDDAVLADFTRSGLLALVRFESRDDELSLDDGASVTATQASTGLEDSMSISSSASGDGVVDLPAQPKNTWDSYQELKRKYAAEQHGNSQYSSNYLESVLMHGEKGQPDIAKLAAYHVLRSRNKSQKHYRFITGCFQGAHKSRQVKRICADAIAKVYANIYDGNDAINALEIDTSSVTCDSDQERAVLMRQTLTDCRLGAVVKSLGMTLDVTDGQLVVTRAGAEQQQDVRSVRVQASSAG